MVRHEERPRPNLRLAKRPIFQPGLGRIARTGGACVRPGGRPDSGLAAATLMGGSTGGWQTTMVANQTEETCPCESRT